MVGLLRGMEEKIQSNDKEKDDSQSVEIAANVAIELNGQQAHDTVSEEADQEENEATCKQLKSILKQRGQYTFRKVKVDFDLIPTLIPYDENDYTIEIQIVDKDPIKIKSWAAIFAARKAEAEAEAAAAAEAEIALKKAEEVRKKEELMKAAKLGKILSTKESHNKDCPLKPSTDGTELVTTANTSENYTAQNPLANSFDPAVSDDSELNSEGIIAPSTEDPDLAELTDIVAAEIDDIIDESLIRQASVECELPEENSTMENHKTAESEVSLNPKEESPKELTQSQKSVDSRLSKLKNIPDEVIGTAAELLEDILSQTPLILNGSLEHNGEEQLDEENIELEIDGILEKAEAQIEDTSATEIELSQTDLKDVQNEMVADSECKDTHRRTDCNELSLIGEIETPNQKIPPELVTIAVNERYGLSALVVGVWTAFRNSVSSFVKNVFQR